MDQIESLPLHDALVENLRLDWMSFTLEIDVLAFTQRDKAAKPFTFRFNGVSSFQAPHKCPWGESVSINTILQDGDGYRIEMQSGDVLLIEASSYVFESRNL